MHMWSMQELLPLPSVPGLGLQDSQRSAVLPSIGSALDWLRRCVRERPNLRVQARPPATLLLQLCLHHRSINRADATHAAGAGDRLAVPGGGRPEAPQEGRLSPSGEGHMERPLWHAAKACWHVGECWMPLCTPGLYCWHCVGRCSLFLAAISTVREPGCDDLQHFAGLAWARMASKSQNSCIRAFRDIQKDCVQHFAMLPTLEGQPATLATSLRAAQRTCSGLHQEMPPFVAVPSYLCCLSNPRRVTQVLTYNYVHHCTGRAPPMAASSRVNSSSMEGTRPVCSLEKTCRHRASHNPQALALAGAAQRRGHMGTTLDIPPQAHQLAIVVDLKGPSGGERVLQRIPQEPDSHDDGALLVLVAHVQLWRCHAQPAKQLLAAQHDANGAQLTRCQHLGQDRLQRCVKT